MLINHRQMSENKGFPLTQLPASRRLTRRRQRQQKLPAMTADRRVATLRANKCVICIFYIYHEYSSFHPTNFQNDLKKKFFTNFFYQINLPMAVCVIKLFCLPKGLSYAALECHWNTFLKRWLQCRVDRSSGRVCAKQ